jgi:hypothetical protein
MRKQKRNEVEKNTLQFILNRKKCTIPDDYIVKRKEYKNNRIIMVKYNKCNFRPDYVKFNNAYKHKIKETEIKEYRDTRYLTLTTGNVKIVFTSKAAETP